MDMQFVRGQAAAPRGHAIIIARPYNRSDKVYATYCFVPPIQVSMGSLGRFLPPIVAQQFGDSLRDMTGNTSATPFPPMLEEAQDADTLIALAEARDDDVVEVRDLSDLQSEARRLELVMQISLEYGQLYVRYANSPSFAAKTRPVTPQVNESSMVNAMAIESLLSESTPSTEAQQLGEVARLIGTLRYALDGPDHDQVEETKRALRRATALLSDKYRADDLIDAASIPGPKGQQLADLYLQRAFRLAEEDYAAIPAIELQIQALQQ